MLPHIHNRPSRAGHHTHQAQAKLNDVRSTVLLIWKDQPFRVYCDVGFQCFTTPDCQVRYWIPGEIHNARILTSHIRFSESICAWWSLSQVDRAGRDLLWFVYHIPNVSDKLLYINTPYTPFRLIYHHPPDASCLWLVNGWCSCSNKALCVFVTIIVVFPHHWATIDIIKSRKWLVLHQISTEDSNSKLESFVMTLHNNIDIFIYTKPS